MENKTAGYVWNLVDLQPEKTNGLSDLTRKSFAYVAERLGRNDFTLVSASTGHVLRFDDGRTAGPHRDLDLLVLQAASESGAVLDATNTYRYRLWRTISRDKEPRNVVWILLNPSTADAAKDDPTIRRCLGYSRAWGYERMTVVNLFALRSANPKALREHADPVGPENDKHLVYAAHGADLVICAWGNHGSLHNRAADVRTLLAAEDIPLHCLRVSKTGQPVHPLYQAGSLKPAPFFVSAV